VQNNPVPVNDAADALLTILPLQALPALPRWFEMNNPGLSTSQSATSQSATSQVSTSPSSARLASTTTDILSIDPDLSVTQFTLPLLCTVPAGMGNQTEEEAATAQWLVEHDAFGSLWRIGQCLQAQTDETLVFQTVIQEMVKVLNLTGCQFSLYNLDATRLVARHELRWSPPPQAQAEIHRVDFPIDMPDMAYYLTQFCSIDPAEPQSVTIVTQPIIDASGLLGWMRLERRQPDYFRSLELQFITQVVSQCAVALRRHRLAQSHRTQALEIRHLSKLQEAFLGTISYELRVPLSNIRMAIQMLTLTLTKEGEKPEAEILLTDETLAKILRYLEVLERECDREAKLIQNLLDLQQLDLDTLSLVMSAIDLEEWLPYVMPPFQKRAMEYQQALSWQIQDNLPAFMCDQITLSRIVTELLNNAHKFTPAGQLIQLTITQLSATDALPQRLQIMVTNTGAEIPIEERERIFEKFYRVSKMDIRKLGGTGLGLALVDKLVQRLGGSIRLESLPQKTQFIVELPFAQLATA
jgi:signal transduction histidine kinase